MKRTALIASIALTAFVLLILGGVLAAVGGARRASAASAANTASTASATQALDADLQAQISERESAYQDLVAQANTRLEEAQQQIQDLQSQIQALQSASQPAADPAALAVTPQQAAQIAAKYMGDNQVYSVESLPGAQGQVYRVTFSSGDVVMVSAGGQVLSVEKAASQVAAGQSVQASSHGEHESHDEHEDHDD